MPRLLSNLSVTALILSLGLVVACGQKGPLIEPADADQKKQSQAESAEKATAK